MPLHAAVDMECDECHVLILAGSCIRPILPLANPKTSSSSVRSKLKWAHFDCVQADDERVPVCKHWAKRGECMYDEKCNFRHPRIKCTSGESVLHDEGANSQMQNKRRYRRRKIHNEGRCGALRRWCLRVFGQSYLMDGGVLDVAGGKGELAFEFLNLNSISSTVVDPRSLDLYRYRRKLYFGYYHRNDVLGMYNTIQRPIEEVEIQRPFHIRAFFEMPGVKSSSSELCLHDTSPNFLVNTQYFDEALEVASSICWTLKGLTHEKDTQQERDQESGQNLEMNLTLKEEEGQVLTPERGIEYEQELELEGVPNLRSESDLGLEQEEDKNQHRHVHEEMLRLTLLQGAKESARDSIIYEANECTGERDDRPYKNRTEYGGCPITVFSDACKLVFGCSLVVGMHCDQGAEHIVEFCLRNHKPFAIVPCCVYSREFPRRKLRNGLQVRLYGDLIEYLLDKHEDIHALEMDFEGKNVMLYYLAGQIPLNDPNEVIAHLSKGPIDFSSWRRQHEETYYHCSCTS